MAAARERAARAEAEAARRRAESLTSELTSERDRLRDENAQRQRAEALLAGQKGVLELIARGAPLAETLHALARLVESQAEGMVCSILLVDGAGRRLRHGAAPGLPDAYNRAIDGIAIGPAVGCCGTAAYRRVPVVVSDIASDPLWDDFRELGLVHGLRACWSTPILAADGRVLGTFAIYYREPREPGLQDRGLVATLTYLAGIAIERARAEEERERLAAQVRAERTRLQELFMQAPTAIGVFRGPEHRLELINPTFQQITGNRPFSLGRTVREVWPELQGSGIFEALDRVYATGEPFVGTEALLRFDRDGDGELEDAYFTFIAQVTRDADGAIEGVLDLGYEVTDQVRARQEIEATVRARDEFLSIAAHELRTPVTGIKGTAELALRAQAKGTLDQVRAEKALRTIDRSSDRLAQLMDDLLDVSRIQGGQLALRPERLDLVALVRGVVERLDDRLEEGLAVDADLPKSAVFIEADAGRLEQVLDNLLTNAVKYSPAGGTIEVRLIPESDGVTVAIKDDGIGLPRGSSERIFEPFGRAPNAAARNLPGMGLGLYISRRIVELHRGRLWAESAGEGRGATMRVWLPGASLAAGVLR